MAVNYNKVCLFNTECPDCGFHLFNIRYDGLTKKVECGDPDCDREKPVKEVVEGPTP